MSRKRLQQLTESLGRSARHFNKSEVECLIKLFDSLVAKSSSSNHHAVVGLDHDMFRDTLHSAFGLTDDMMMDRVFRIFDTACDNCISVVEWVEGLSVFLRGTLDERIKFCFEVYDLNGDGYISREEMFQMLKNSLLKQPAEDHPDEGIKDLVDIALKKMLEGPSEPSLTQKASSGSAICPSLEHVHAQLSCRLQPKWIPSCLASC